MELIFYCVCVSDHTIEVVFSADEAVRRSKDGDKVILVRIETSPDDIHGLHAAEGVLTTRGWQVKLSFHQIQCGIKGCHVTFLFYQ